MSHTGQQLMSKGRRLCDAICEFLVPRQFWNEAWKLECVFCLICIHQTNLELCFWELLGEIAYIWRVEIHL